MSTREALKKLTGRWSGSNRLWLDPQAPADLSETSAVISLAAGERFLVLQNTWAFDGQPQDGVLLIGIDENETPREAVWIDSMHTAGKIMSFQGKAEDADWIAVTGSYAAPEGPDWGWRIELQPQTPERFEIRMFNLIPGEEEALAVRAEYTRQA